MDRLYTFLGLFSLVYFFESIGHSYIISALQNIEKQFQIPSRLSGFMISAGDIGYIPSVLFVAYLGSKGNRARWIGGGALLMACAYLLMSSPNFIFPVITPRANLTQIERELHPSEAQLSENATLNDLLEYPLIRDRLPKPLRAQLLGLPPWQKLQGVPLLDEPFAHPNASFYSIDGWLLEEICDEAEEVVNGESADKLMGALRQFIHNRLNKTTRDLHRISRSAKAPFSYCGRIVNNIRRITKEVRCREQGGNFGPFTILFTALFMLGVGRTVPWSLGVPLVDDNIKKTNVPAYFGFISFIRILGPVCGHLVGSFVNKIYYTLKAPPGLTANDPAWIGAWWLGFLIIGIVLIFPSLAVFFFPSGKNKKVNPGSKKTLQLFDKYKEKTVEHTSFREKATEFLKGYRAVLKTKIYAGSIVGRICDILALKGYIVFMPKYLENHFGIPLYKVHQLMAAFGVFGLAVGTLLGGLIIRKFKLNGRHAAMFIVIGSSINVMFYFSKAFIACNSVVSSVGLESLHTNYNFTRQCNTDCGCDGAKLYPVCTKEGTPFYSPCHAGCREVRINYADSNDIEFSSCECAESGTVRKNYCKDDCAVPKIIFFTTVVLGSLAGGMCIVPGMLILLRSVPPATRSMSLALQGLLVSLLGTLPSPVIWGMVIDSTCLVWERTCPDQNGHCAIYDTSSLRMRLHFMYCAIRLVSVITDIYVWYHARDLNILDDGEPEAVPKGDEQESIGMTPVSAQ